MSFGEIRYWGCWTKVGFVMILLERAGSGVNTATVGHILLEDVWLSGSLAVNLNFEGDDEAGVAAGVGCRARAGGQATWNSRWRVGSHPHVAVHRLPPPPTTHVTFAKKNGS